MPLAALCAASLSISLAITLSIRNRLAYCHHVSLERAWSTADVRRDQGTIRPGVQHHAFHIIVGGMEHRVQQSALQN